MKKSLFLLIILALFLTGCGQSDAKMKKISEGLHDKYLSYARLYVDVSCEEYDRSGSKYIYRCVMLYKRYLFDGTNNTGPIENFTYYVLFESGNSHHNSIDPNGLKKKYGWTN